MTTDAELPDYCVWCAQPTSRRVHKTFYWLPWWVWVLIYFSIGIGLIFAFAKLQKMALQVPVCDQCFSRQQKKLGIGVIILLSSLPMAAVVGIVTGNPALVISIGCLLLGIGWIVVMLNKNLLMPTEIDSANGFGYFRGASARFLARFPNTND